LPYFKGKQKPANAGLVLDFPSGVLFNPEHGLEKEIALSQGKHGGRFTRQKLSVRNYFIGLEGWVRRRFRMPRLFTLPPPRKRTRYFLLGNRHQTGWICPMLITQALSFRLLGWLGVWFSLIGGMHAQLTGGAATISAGIGIGQVRIGETLDDVHRALGTPKLGDAAMGGKLLEVWRSGPAFGGRRQIGIEELEIYFRRAEPDLSGQPVVQQIRVTSPFFQTPSGISVRSSFGQISGEFPNLSDDEVLTYAINGGRSEKEIEMLVDRARGIAFEFRNGAAIDPDAKGYCRAIHIFQPNTDPRPIQNFARASEESED
jgi:hypothetical protein